MLSYQSPMPVGAGTPRYENETWSLEVFGCGWCHPSPLDSRFRENDEFGVRDMLSYQSLVPAGAGTPRYENWVHWLMEGSGVVCATHPTPGWGQAPALHFSCDPRQSLFGRRWLASPAGAGIDPGSESGTCFPTKVDDFLRRLELLANASNLASPVLTKLPAGWSNSRRRCIGA